MSLDGAGLALQVERLEGFGADRIPDERARLGADEDLAARRRLLEPGRYVDGVARHERLVRSPDHDLAGIDADARVEAVLGDRSAHLDGGPHGAQRVVFVRDGNAEDGHDRIPDELLDRPAVSLEDRAKVLEVPAHASAQRLRIGRLAERGRTHEVAEQHGDDLALLPHER